MPRVFLDLREAGETCSKHRVARLMREHQLRAVVMDLFSRKIVGWSATPTIHRELVLDAVLIAVRRRRPRGTMIHSDQGTHWRRPTSAATLGGASAAAIAWNRA